MSNKSRIITIFAMQNGFEQKTEVYVDNSENHVDNLVELIMNLLKKKDDKDEDTAVKVKVFDNAVQTLVAASNADTEISVATIAAILADVTID